MDILVWTCLQPVPFCSVDIKKPAAFSEPNQASATQQKSRSISKHLTEAAFQFTNDTQGNSCIPQKNSTN
jgi:hypothetical protein